MADFHLSDEQFFTILRENAGIFAQTARAIQQTFGIDYSRQAVRERALKQPEILADIEDEGLDIAEEGMNSLAQSPSEDTKFKACQFILRTKGRKRGYGDKLEIAGNLDIVWHEEKTYVTKDQPSAKVDPNAGMMLTKAGWVPK